MASHNGQGASDLPATWPFRVAGTILIVALAWFCLGFAVADVGDKLDGHMTVFWYLIAASVLFVLGGAAFNIERERRRKQHG